MVLDPTPTPPQPCCAFSGGDTGTGASETPPAVAAPSALPLVRKREAWKKSLEQSPSAQPLRTGTVGGKRLCG